MPDALPFVIVPANWPFPSTVSVLGEVELSVIVVPLSPFSDPRLRL